MNIYDLGTNRLHSYDDEKVKLVLDIFPILKSYLDAAVDPKLIAQADIDYLIDANYFPLWDKLYVSALIAIARIHELSVKVGKSIGASGTSPKTQEKIKNLGLGNLIIVNKVSSLDEFGEELYRIHQGFDKHLKTELADMLHHAEQVGAIQDNATPYLEQAKNISEDQVLLKKEERYTFFLVAESIYVDVLCSKGRLETAFMERWLQAPEFALVKNKDMLKIEAEYIFDSFTPFVLWFNNIRQFFEIELAMTSINKILDKNPTSDLIQKKSELDAVLKEISEKENQSVVQIRSEILRMLYSVLNDLNNAVDGDVDYFKFYPVNDFDDLGYNMKNERFNINLYYSFNQSSDSAE